MSDIVQRLHTWTISPTAVPASDLMDEAADEIKRLRSRPCPYVTGTVTKHCTLTPFTLTDAELEAVEYFSEWCIGPSKRLKRYRDTLRGLLKRTK